MQVNPEIRRSFAALLLAFLLIGLGHADQPNAAQPLDYFSKQNFNASDFAAAVNHFVRQGEDVAIVELKRIAKLPPSKTARENNNRVMFLARALFINQKEPIRRPLIGAFMIPINGNDKSDWPLFPIAKSGECYFLLNNAILLGGLPESANKYLEHCQSHGTFRDQEVIVPNRVRAQNDLKKLWDSERWTTIDWNVPNPKAAERHFRKFIASQADSIPR